MTICQPVQMPHLSRQALPWLVHQKPRRSHRQPSRRTWKAVKLVREPSADRPANFEESADLSFSRLQFRNAPLCLGNGFGSLAGTVAEILRFLPNPSLAFACVVAFAGVCVLAQTVA